MKKDINSVSTREIILGFVFLNILSGTASGVLSMIIPLYAISINASAAQVGLIRGISGIGLLILVLPSGFLVDYYGSKKLYIIGGLVFSASIFFLPFAIVPILVMVIMAFQGLANSLRFTSLNAAFFKYLDVIGKDKAGWYRGSMSLGLTFLGPFIGGYGVGIMNYKAIFYTVGFISLVPVIIMVALIKRNKTKKPFKFSGVFKEQLLDFKLILKNNVVKQMALVESLSTACFSSFITFIVVLVVKKYQYKSYYASWLVILEGSAFIFVVFLGGKIVDKYKDYKLYLGSFVMVIIGSMWIVLTNKIQFLGAATIIIGLGLGMTNLITYCQIGALKGKKGKISGLFSACSGLGSTFGPILGGIIGEFFGIKAVFISFVPIFILIGIYVIKNATSENETTGVEQVS
ncbi:MAG: MFS transporter [Bacillota bacterium]|nr:MFS transporter [Bacillota bacterium]